VVDGFVLDGPRRVQQRHQITLPEDQLRLLGLTQGSRVWIGINPDKPGTLVVVPEPVYAEILRKGWSSI
jgi:bifunctional DNA-binding transcriptional regulator/antitoxin component of YhaV-PrlF toxin-antitoxin module